jgi:hypothetical protein
MTPGKQHQRVEALKVTRQQALSQLFFTDGKGKQQPRYSDELQAQKVREIEDAYDHDLRALMETAQGLYDEAEAKLTRVDRPYGWLTADEMAAAASMAPFVKEDIAAMDANAVLQTVKSAAAAGQVERWLIDRYARQRWQELDATIETAPGMSTKAHFEKSAAELQDSIMPENRRKERDTAKAQLRDAQDLHDAAEWARPAVRQAAADRWRVDVNHLPE